MKTRIYIIIALFFCSVTLISWLMLDQLVQADKRTKREIFNNQVQAYVNSFTTRYHAIKIMMGGFEGFFAGSEEVSYEEWKAYSNHLQLSEVFPEMIWIGLVRRVLNADKSAFYSSVKKLSHQNIKIWPEANRAYYYPVEFVSPESYEHLMGYDLCTNETVCQVLHESDFKQVSVTPSVHLGPNKVNRCSNPPNKF